MDGYTASTYGDGFADVYDEWYRDLGDTDRAIDVLAALATGPTLELGIGTGRLARPLTARGVPVVGIDTSEGMLAALRAHEAGRVPAARADMCRLPFRPARFAFVFAAYNVLFNVPDTASQQECFADVHRALASGGRFLVEAFVFDEVDGPRNGVEVRDVTLDRVILTASKLESESQTIAGQHIEISSAGITMRPWFLHYLHVAQLDEMAESTGFVLEERWQDWDRTPFEPASARHLSLYRRR